MEVGENSEKRKSILTDVFQFWEQKGSKTRYLKKLTKQPHTWLADRILNKVSSKPTTGYRELKIMKRAVKVIYDIKVANTEQQ